MHALIIEDELMIATVIEFVLRDCGFDSFDIAPRSDSAIAAASRRRPDLITADIKLEAGSGLDAVRAICPQASIPVIFITGNALEIRDQITDSPVLNKPFSEQTLTYAVKASLTRMSSAAA
jgi:DNA-binding response OmpR family regulator